MLQLSIAYVFLEHDLQCDHVVCLFLLCQVHIAKARLFLRIFILRRFILLTQI